MFAELDLSKGTLSNLRLGKKISADSLARIADYLDCSIDFLMGRTVDPTVKRMNLTDEYIGKRTTIVNDEHHGTVLITEGAHFVIDE